MTEKKRVRKRPSAKAKPIPEVPTRRTEPAVKTELDRLDTSPAVVLISNTPKLEGMTGAGGIAPTLFSLGLHDLQAIASYVDVLRSLSYNGATWTATSKPDGHSNIVAVGKSEHSPKLAIASMITDAREKGIMI